MCSGAAPELEERTSFVGRWLEILRPGYERVRHIDDAAQQLAALERQTVVVSLDNLMSFPFVAGRVAAGTLSLHGLWHDIGSGALEQYRPRDGLPSPPCDGAPAARVTRAGAGCQAASGSGAKRA